MIDIRDLIYQYREGAFRLEIPELKVGAGEKVAVIGPSGSGKTTLLNLIAGILAPDGGTVDVDGKSLHGMSDGARRRFRLLTLGFVFQDFELLEYLPLVDNILHPYRISRALTINREVRARAAQLAEEMGIAEKLSAYPATLSRGEAQRAAICRALISGPKLILADEATGNLDPINKLRIMDLLCRASERRGASLLAVTHDYDLLELFDRVIDFKDWIAGNG